MNWADLFDRGERYDVTVEAIRDSHTRLREDDDE